ncbi:hypothetical protein Gohar_005609 [Gossypium harknessii]|uniref:D-isomer specific 2-hydroxyacid dehydrogenase NAD-binding domain-containing protein n=1 Tax=Gossypium harknessii TaxID=34285 RepID=A0A7J9H8P8_9ROSI|nr:hypothetical protein [Gossypium harknessii]
MAIQIFQLQYLQECYRRGIAVTTAGQVFTEDVSDFAVGLLPDVLRSMSASDRYVRSGSWVAKGAYPPGIKVITFSHNALILYCSLMKETHNGVMEALGKVRKEARKEHWKRGNVYEDEPHVPPELFAMDNIVLAPHAAVYTPESFEALQELVIGNLKAFFFDQPLISPAQLE